ncbi:MFS transporter [Alloscardovia omnicolens]|uniref:MFS transporter n=1 Tax=Alloscardovia omnicolens TaxID=419015 RepID=UPI003A624311
MTDMQRKSTIRLRIGILSLATLTLSGIFITPIIAQIAQAFPHESASTVQLLISINTLMNLVGAWIVTSLRKITSLKNISLMAVTGIGIFGLLPVFFHHSLWMLIVFSGSMGIFLGFLATVLPTIISENFNNQERQGIMGQQVAFSSIGAMIFIIAIGKLGTINWHIAYTAYAAAFIILAIVAFMLPSDKVHASDETKTDLHLHMRDVLSGKSITLLVCGFIFVAMMTSYNTNISLIISESQLGNSHFAGLITMLNQIGGLLAGLLVGVLVRVIKTRMYSIAFLCEGIGFLLIALYPTTWTLAAGSFIAGMGCSFYYAQAPFLMSVIQKPWLIPAGIAVLTTANGLGGFASPFIINGINALMFNASAHGALLVSGSALIIGAIALFITNFQAHCMSSQEK